MAVAVCGCAVATCLAIVPAADAAFPPAANGRIIFDRASGAETDLWLMTRTARVRST
jgi:hypothetical protein